MADTSSASGSNGAAHATGPRDPRVARRARAKRAKKGSQSRPILAGLARLGLALTGRLSPSAAYRLGGVLGRSYGCWPTRSARAARVNLEICFPELCERERRALFRESFAHTGRCFLEFGRIWCGRDQGLPGIVREEKITVSPRRSVRLRPPERRVASRIRASACAVCRRGTCPR